MKTTQRSGARRFLWALHFLSASRCCVGVDLFNRPAYAEPDGQVGEDLHDAALIGEGRLLQDGQILHHAVMHDVFHDLVYEINLTAVQIRVVQERSEGGLGRVHVQTHDLTHELTQRLWVVLFYC